jgi:hypothetical protein
MKFILIFILMLVVLGWLLNALLKYFVRNLFGNLENRHRQDRQAKSKTGRRGEVHIDKQPPRDKKIKKDVGEYVDYEEIK